MAVLHRPSQRGLERLGRHQQVAGGQLRIQGVGLVQRCFVEADHDAWPSLRTGRSRSASTTFGTAARALISTTSPRSSGSQSSTSSRVGMVRPLPAKGVEPSSAVNRAPASSFRRFFSVKLTTAPLPFVVRSTVSSWMTARCHRW